MSIAPASLLIVDDTPENLRVLEGFLSGEGHRVRAAPGGKLALASAAKHPPDLVLLDINMPEMDGLEVCRRFKADPALREVPILFLSAYTDLEHKVKAFEVGGADYVTKPFQWEEVRARVNTHLALARALRDLRARHAAMEGELARAREVQKMILPKPLALGGIHHRIHFEPCHQVAGDYVDIIRMPDGKILTAIADVCGKGMQAALVASFLHTYLHAEARQTKPLAEIVAGLNRYLIETLSDSSFVTLCAVIWDPASHRIGWINAGHPAPIVVTPGGGVRTLRGPVHIPLGVDDCAFVPDHCSIGRKEILALFTDGLVEIAGGPDMRLLGAHGLESLLAKSADLDLAAMDRHLTHGLKAHRGDLAQEDDQTCILLRRSDADDEG